MKMIEHNHFICHLILGTFTEYPFLNKNRGVQTEFKNPFCTPRSFIRLFIRLLSYTFQPFHHEQHDSH